MSNHRRARPYDLLPTYEPFLPVAKEDAVLIFGMDRGAMPNWYKATDAPPGSVEKIEVLRYRAAHGLPLWHPNDKVDLEGVVGIVLFDQRGMK